MLSLRPFAPCLQASSEVCSVPTAPLVFQSQKEAQAPPSLLLEPTYGHGRDDGGPYHPTRREVLREWLDAMDGWHHPERRLPAFFFVFHVATGLVGAIAFLNFSWDGLAFGIASGLWVSTLYHSSGITGTARTLRSRSPARGSRVHSCGPTRSPSARRCMRFRIASITSAPISPAIRTARTSAGWGAISPPSRSRR